MRALLFAALVIGVSMTSSALAQEDVGPVAACRAAHAGDAASHIACLERAVEALSVDAATEATPSRPAWSLPGFRQREEDRREQEAQRVNVRLVEVRYGGDGLGRFVTEEGQIWRETTPAPAHKHLRAGRTYDAVIFRNFLGFRMHVEGVVWEFRVEPIT